MSATVWVCGACGKHGWSRRTVGDESCYIHAVECHTTSLVFDGWRVVKAVAATEPWVDGPPEPKPLRGSRRLDAPARLRRVARRAERRCVSEEERG